MAHRRAHLVLNHLEMVHRDLLERHRAVVQEYVRGKRGIYSLYSGTRLYYVGLAENLPSRLKQHLRDRHGDAWDHFSLYLTDVDQNLRELEALILRITMPKGNRSKTRFPGSYDLKRNFKVWLDERHRADVHALLVGQDNHTRRRPTSRRNEGADDVEPSASGLVRRPTRIRLRRHGKLHFGILRPDGTINVGGKSYSAPSAASSAIKRRASNGWNDWWYEESPERWVRLTTLRSQVPRRGNQSR